MNKPNNIISNYAMDKYLSFEYFLKGIWDWYYEAFPEKNPAQNENDLSILKCLKLLFLATAAEIDQRESNDDTTELLIEGTFDKFSALPLGHVESEIYAHIRENKGVLTYFILTRENLICTNADFPDAWPNVNINSINFAINALKAKNPVLINMRAYQLVDLTHKWASWRILYKKEHGSAPIPNNIIKSERKYFY